MHSDKSAIDFIIVTFKSTAHLINCINSITSNSTHIDYQLIIINNGPKEDLIYNKSIPSNSKVVQNTKNIGFARAVNQALKLSTAPIICVLNPDTIVLEDFVKKSLACLTAYPAVGVLGPKIYNSDGSVQGSARSFPTLLTTFFGRSSWLTKAFPNNSLSRKNVLTIDYNRGEPIEADWVSGACMVVRRSVVKSVGDLDRRYFMYWEDADWCRRIRQSGWNVFYFPEASIMHACSQSSKSRPLKSILHFHLSCYRLLVKSAKWRNTLLLPIALSGLIFRSLILIMHSIITQRLYSNSLTTDLKDVKDK